MSIFVPAALITPEAEKVILDELYVEKKLSGFIAHKYKFVKSDKIFPYQLVPNPNQGIPLGINLPFRWAIDNIPGAGRKPSDSLDPLSQPYKFTRELRPIQQEVKGGIISSLNTWGCHLLSLYPGAGKTNLAIYLASRVKLKTLIICDTIILLNQWKEAIEGCLSPKPSVSIVKQPPKNNEKALKKFKDSLESDFLLIYVENIAVIGRDAFSKVGFVIIDEIHKILAENLSTCLFHLSPRFLLGLSATPTRPDGLDKLLDFYFGTLPETRTLKELYHPHIVYHIPLPFDYSDIPSTDWTRLITAQCNSVERNTIICETLCKFLTENPLRNVLVLSKRIEQVEWLEGALSTLGFRTSSLAGSKNTYDPEAQIILGITSKVGTGFSCDKLDTLVIASDLISSDTSGYMIQYLARVMRTKEVKPIVFEFVDDHKVLKKHFGIRKGQYTKHGGIIKKLKL